MAERSFVATRYTAPTLMRAPMVQVFRTAIALVVKNVAARFYGEHFLSITGPLLFRRALELHPEVRPRLELEQFDEISIRSIRGGRVAVLTKAFSEASTPSGVYATLWVEGLVYRRLRPHPSSGSIRFYLWPLPEEQLGVYAKELRASLAVDSRRVVTLEAATHIIVPYSDEANYPNYDMRGGASIRVDPCALLDDIGGEQPCVIFLHTTPDRSHPRMLNVGYCASRIADVTIVPPCLKNYAWTSRGGGRKYFASFKGTSTRSATLKEDFETLRRHHDGCNVIICDASDGEYDYDELLTSSIFAFVLEGDLP